MTATEDRPRPDMHKSLVLTLLAVAVLVVRVRAQATWNSADVPQPHLAKARAIAAEDNSWRHAGLVTCYPNDGQASQNVNKDPSGFRVFDNVYYVGDGKYPLCDRHGQRDHPHRCDEQPCGCGPGHSPEHAHGRSRGNGAGLPRIKLSLR